MNTIMMMIIVILGILITIPSFADEHKSNFRSNLYTECFGIPSTEDYRGRKTRSVSLGDDPAQYAAVALRSFLEVGNLICKRSLVWNVISIFTDASVGTLVELLKSKEASYGEIRHYVLRDIREQLNRRKVDAMRDKIETISDAVSYMVVKISPMNITLVELKDIIQSNKTLEEPPKRTENWEVFKYELNALKMILETSRDDFVLREDYYLSLPYYNLYATTHIYVLGLLKTVYPELSSQYDKEMKDHAKRHYEYMTLAIGEAVILTERSISKKLCAKFSTKTKNMTNGDNPLSKRMSCHQQKLVKLYGLENLIKLSEAGKNDGRILRSGDVVAFRLATLEEDKWLSCAKAGSLCTFTSLAEVNNPFKCFDRGFGEEFANSDVIFTVHATDKGAKEVVASCDSIAFQYESTSNNYLYAKYEQKCIWVKSCAAKTSQCPGSTFQDGDPSTNNDCPHHVFTAMVPGKQCGDPIMDRDPVAIISADDRVIAPEKWRLQIDISLRDSTDACENKRTWLVYKYKSLNNAYLRGRDGSDTRSLC